MDEREEGFLPPEPAGPEPEVGETSPRPPQQPAAPPPGYQQPPPAYQPPPGYQQPPPAYPGWQPPAGYQPPPPPPPGYYGWAPPPVPRQPDNGPAVAGFVLSMASAGLWLFSAGLSSIISIVCAGLGVFYSRRGKEKLDAGETQKHKDLAKAGFIIGWVMVGLAALSTIAWVLIFVLAGTSESFQDDMQRELQDSEMSGGLRVATAALCTGAPLVC